MECSISKYASVMFSKLASMNGPDSYRYTKFMIQRGPIWDAEFRVWDAKNLGPVSPGTHRNKFVKKITE